MFPSLQIARNSRRGPATNIFSNTSMSKFSRRPSKTEQMRHVQIEGYKSNIPCCAVGARNICMIRAIYDAHRSRILPVTFPWHMRQIHAGCARHNRESDANVARTCCARSAQGMSLLDPSVHVVSARVGYLEPKRAKLVRRICRPSAKEFSQCEVDCVIICQVTKSYPF
jgi:hypothetical protein